MVFLSLTVDFVVSNSADPDEMPHNAEFDSRLGQVKYFRSTTYTQKNCPNEMFLVSTQNTCQILGKNIIILLCSKRLRIWTYMLKIGLSKICLYHQFNPLRINGIFLSGLIQYTWDGALYIWGGRSQV